MDLILLPILLILSSLWAFPMICGFLVIAAVWTGIRSKAIKDEKAKSSYRKDTKILLSGAVIVIGLYLSAWVVIGMNMEIKNNGMWRVCHGWVMGNTCLGVEGERECCGLQTPFNIRRGGE